MYAINKNATLCKCSCISPAVDFPCFDLVIQRDAGFIAHTAFGLLSLKQYVETFEDDEGSSATLVGTTNRLHN